MNIVLRMPFSVSENETGTKNTEIIHPNHNSVNKKERLFISCCGHSPNSSIAGRIICESINLYFRSFADENTISLPFIEKALRMGEIGISDYIKKHPEAKGISTTMSLFYLSSNSIHISQIGRSHIYQIRENRIINKYINISDQKIQGIEKPEKINLYTLKDIKAQDQFFICHDNLSDWEDEIFICETLSQLSDAEEKLSEIKRHYLNKYKIPFTGHLIPIREIKETNSLKRRLNFSFFPYI